MSIYKFLVPFLLAGLLACQPAQAATPLPDGNHCPAETAILWLRLGMAIGANTSPPDRLEMARLLESVSTGLGTPPAAVHEPAGEQTGSLANINLDDGELSSIGQDTFWLRIGDPAAPLVYMILDPTCPFCHQAINLMAPAIQARQLQIRAIPVPLLSDESLAVSASILLAPDPGAALWNHLTDQDPIRVDATSSTLLLENLGPRGQGWLQANITWLANRQLFSVPVFIWAAASNDGGIDWRIEEGVQEVTTFQDALPPLEPSTASFGLPAENGEPIQVISTVKPLPVEPLPLQ